MNRDLMYDTIVVNGIEELDFSTGDFTFEMTRAPQYYRIAETDCTRLDRVSYLFYQNDRFWWIIASVNNIEDVLNDLVPGTVLTIPDVLDIYDFYKQQRKR